MYVRKTNSTKARKQDKKEKSGKEDAITHIIHNIHFLGVENEKNELGKLFAGGLTKLGRGPQSKSAGGGVTGTAVPWVRLSGTEGCFLRSPRVREGKFAGSVGLKLSSGRSQSAMISDADIVVGASENNDPVMGVWNANPLNPLDEDNGAFCGVLNA